MTRKPAASEKKPADGDKAAVVPAQPLKPRPRLFVALCLAFALWIAVLITLYVTTVYPHRAQ